MKSTSSISYLNNATVMRAWALFDTANSAHALVIAAAIFPAYYLNITDEEIFFLGQKWKDSTLYAWAISFSYLVVAAISPLLSGIADYGNKRKTFLRTFTYMGSVACFGLYFFDGMDRYWFGISCFSISLIGFAGGLVFYNAYLPIITTVDRMDWLSARGFAYGYAGSVLLLLVILFFIMQPEAVGLADAGSASRLGFAMVGIWWIAIASYVFTVLPPDGKQILKRRVFTMGYFKILKVWRQIRSRKNISRFLLSFFTYSMGVQTVLLLAATFAESEMEFKTAELIALILLIQLVAIAGAYLFAFVSRKKGNKFALMVQLAIWIVICIFAYLVKEKLWFYMLAVLVGMVFGGIQALSRSTYAKFVANEPRSSTSFFSFYDVLEKLAIVLGTMVFGLVAELSGSMRNSTLILAVFFLVGAVLLSAVQVKDRESVRH